VDDRLVPGASTATAPGVVHHVRGQPRLRVGTAQIGGGEHPLAGGQQGRAGAAAVLAALGGDPAGPGRHPDLIARPVVTDHGAGDVGAVAVVVARRGGAADTGRVEPVVVVVVPGAGVAPVLLSQGRVVELHAGVDAGDHDSVAGPTELVPHPRRADHRDVPLDRIDRLVGAERGVQELPLPAGFDPGDVGAAGQQIGRASCRDREY